MQDSENPWTERLITLDPVVLPSGHGESVAPSRLTRHELAPSRDRDAVAASFIIYAARLSGRTEFDVAFYEPPGDAADTEPAALIGLPLRVSLARAQSVADAHASVAAALRWVRRHRGIVGDEQVAAATALPVRIAFVEHLRDEPMATNGFALLIARNGATAWDVDAARYPPERITQMQRQFTLALAADAGSAWRALPLVSAQERQLVLYDWALTPAMVPTTAAPLACVHEIIAQQAQRTPRDIAIVCAEATLTYRELDERANQLAHHLQSLGAGPDTLVAICCSRSVEMVVALLAVLKSGAAYVALDSTYSRERTARILLDAQARIILSEDAACSQLPKGSAIVVRLDRDWPVIARCSVVAPATTVTSAHLAYCSYREDDQGKAVGVLVEHRNVTSFFSAMDSRLGIAAGVWLATSSIAQDNSVLELLWTLSRGYTVVIQPDGAGLGPQSAALSNADLSMDFSLFCSSVGDSEKTSDGYRILLDGARFGDEHGFAAVWTPERRLSSSGGLSANPAIAGAAIAAVTKRIAVRGGSCVLGLHDPIRMAEEWSAVDRLSGGRVGMSFAAGAQPSDWGLNAPASARAMSETVATIDRVRRLWRGEQLTLPGPDGDVSLRTLPKPVQSELPVWLTTAGDSESYVLAGQLGVNVLTDLSGQSVQTLRERISLYRETWRAHGHPGAGMVSLMLHTFVGDSDAAVKETVRAPMMAILGSLDSERHAPLDVEGPSDHETDAVLDDRFERYYSSSALFGTEETCAQTVNALKGVGVDDIACVIDFGVDAEQVLGHLEHLNRVRLRTARAAPPVSDASIAALLARHRVTHLQCTPSVAQTLVRSAAGRDALRGLRSLCVGGEPLAPQLAAQLQSAVSGTVYTMYGPAETTAWSAMHTLNGEGLRIPLGVPLAHNELYVLDVFQQPVPPGTAGELFIGGAQVARGYWRQPNLTSERFVPNPFGADRSGRLYRTGDLVRWRTDGKLEFVSRLGHDPVRASQSSSKPSAAGNA